MTIKIIIFLLLSFSLCQAQLDPTKGGTGARTLTGIIFGHGVNPFTALAPLNDTTKFLASDLQWHSVSGGGGGMSIGGAVAGSSTGSVLFIDGSGNLAQDNSFFHYDPAAHALDVIGNITGINGVPYSWTNTQGAVNTFLRNDGFGNLSWVAAGGGGLVNWIDSLNTAAPNATWPVVAFVAKNADLNVDAVITPKDSGAFIVGNIPNNGSGGNKRGAYAVDLQMKRNNKVQVASGFASVIGGGTRNESDGYTSTVSGGYTNSAIADYSSIGGGSGNYIFSGEIESVIGGGAGNVIGNNSHGSVSGILGGQANLINSDSSSILGGSGNLIGANMPYSCILGGCNLQMDSCVGSVAFNGTNPNLPIYIVHVDSLPHSALFLGTDLLVANYDSNAHALKLFSPFQTDNGDFPIDSHHAAKFSAFKAGVQSTSVTYTLPLADATVSGQVLSSDGAGILSWNGTTGTASISGSTVTVTNGNVTNAHSRIFVTSQSAGVTGALRVTIVDNTSFTITDLVAAESGTVAYFIMQQ